MVTTARLRFDLASDHLASLQTDPAYMRRYIRLVTQSEFAKAIPIHERYAVVARSIGLDVMLLYWWLCVQEEVENVRDVRTRHVAYIKRGFPLSKEYDTALASLELVLINQMNARVKFMMDEVRSRPGLAKYTSFEYDGDGKVIARFKDPRTKNSIQEIFRNDKLYWCLLNLCNRADDFRGFNHAHLFSFLEHHMSISPSTERARLDQIIYDQLSDLAAIHQLLLAVRLSRPQNKAGDSFEMVNTENRRSWKTKNSSLKAGLVGGIVVNT